MTEFLSSHSESLRTVFRTAILFRSFLTDVINRKSHLGWPSTLLNIEEEETVQEQSISDGVALLFLREAAKYEAEQPTRNERDESEESEGSGSTLARVRILNFLPGVTKQKDVLDAKILSISPAELDNLCMTSSIGTLERDNVREAGSFVENMQEFQDQL